MEKNKENPTQQQMAQDLANGEFIANARTALPEALRALAELRAALAEGPKCIWCQRDAPVDADGWHTIYLEDTGASQRRKCGGTGRAQ